MTDEEMIRWACERIKQIFDPWINSAEVNGDRIWVWKDNETMRSFAYKRSTLKLISNVARWLDAS